MSTIRLKNKKKPTSDEIDFIIYDLLESMDFKAIAKVGRRLGHTYDKPVNDESMRDTVSRLLYGLLGEWKDRTVRSCGRFTVMLMGGRTEISVLYTPFEASAYIYSNGDVGIVGPV